MFICKSCENEVTDGVTCTQCRGQFDFTCAGITEGKWRRLGVANKAAWKCNACKSLMTASPHTSAVKTIPADSDSIMAEIKRLSTQMEALPTLIDNVRAIKDEMMELKSMRSEFADMKSSLEFVHEAVRSLTDKISTLDQEIEAMKSTKAEFQLLQDRVTQLENSHRENEQRSRMNNIEIKGVPTSNSENLFSVMAKIGSIIGYEIPKEGINYIARVPMRNNSQNKNIICSVHSSYVKNEFVAAAKKHKTLKVSDIGLQGTNRIFVNDHLTIDNKILLNKTKAKAKERGFEHVWVTGCKIMLRRNITSPRLHIKSELDLKKYLN